MDVWTCRECGETKPPAMFVLVDKDHPTKRWCRACVKRYNTDYYKRTKERRAARKKVTSDAITVRNREYVYEILSRSACLDCGEQDIVVLEFDHRDTATKTANVSALIAFGASLARIQQEIDMCDVVCANCHRRRTARQFGWVKAALADSAMGL